VIYEADLGFYTPTNLGHAYYYNTTQNSTLSPQTKVPSPQTPVLSPQPQVQFPLQPSSSSSIEEDLEWIQN
jgi:hypothetical protein